MFRHFEKLNIPGPKPSWIFGNALEIDRRGLLTMQLEWHKTYGPIIGYFMGKTPILAITDVELLKLIEIKDFMDFADRPVSCLFSAAECHLHIIVEQQTSHPFVELNPLFFVGSHSRVL